MKNELMILLIGLILLIPVGIIKGADVNDDQPLATSIDVTLGTAPTVDGLIGSGEWTDASSVSIAQTSGGPWMVYYKHTLTDVYFAFTYGNGFITDLCFDVNNDGGTDPQTDDFKFHSSAANYEYSGTGSGWNRQSISGWSAEQRGMVNVKEYRVSFSKLGITSGVDKTIGIMFYILANPSASDGAWPSGADRDDPSTWGTMSSSDFWGTGVPPNDPSVLENGAVNPASGFTDEEYTFSVDYSDVNDDAPTKSQVIIDGTPRDMTTTGTNYIDGVTFTYAGFLDDTPHSFHFLFNDSKIETRFPETGEIQGPEVITPNTPPELVPGGIPNGTYSIEEDSGNGDDLIDLEEYFSDDRNDGELLFEVTYQESPSKLLATVDGQYLDLSQQWENWFGTLEFRVRAIDYGLDGTISGDDLFTESNTFTIEVAPVNDVPMITRIGPFEITDQDLVVFDGDDSAMEDEWFNISVQVSEVDPDGWERVPESQGPTDEIPFIIEKPSNTSLELSWMPTNDDIGMGYFELIIEDPSGAKDQVRINVEVLNSNDAPYIDLFIQGETTREPEDGIIELTGTRGAIENEWYNFSMSALDEDEGSGLTFSTNTTLANLDIDPLTGDVSFLPGMDDIGTVEFHIIVTDPEGASDSVKILLEVSNSNDPPEITGVRTEGNAFVFPEGTLVNITCRYLDPDLSVDPLETLIVSWESGVDGYLGTGDLLSTSGLSIGTHLITVTVSDAGGLVSSVSLQITIMEPSVIPEPNDPDPNATGGEVKLEKEGAPLGLIIFIVIVALLVIAGAVVLVMMTMKKKDIPDEKDDSPDENTDPNPPQAN